MNGAQAFDDLRRRLETDTDAGQFAAACRDLRGREWELVGCTAAQALALRDVVGPAVGLSLGDVRAFEQFGRCSGRL